VGEHLAAEAPVEADLVLPIPDSGTPAAIGFSRALGIPFSEGLIKNRYVGRTFIQPDQGLREQGIRLKFNPLAEVAGKRLVVVDDSIVRGSTTRQIVAMLFEAGGDGGARAGVVAADRQPVLLRDRLRGRGRADRGRAAASRRSGRRSARRRSPTSRSRAVQEATRRPADSVCRACLTREYPTAVPEEGARAKLRFELARAPA
jgi:Glutamine phosphoribosylpyrophosphate amidotransferase